MSTVLVSKCADSDKNLSNLPPELLEEIYKRSLWSASFGPVCKAWFSVASQNPLPPVWLMSSSIDHREYDSGFLVLKWKHEILCLSEKRIYRIDNIISELDSQEIVGSSNGWLLTKGHDSLRMGQDGFLKQQYGDYTLVNPLFNAQTRLEFPFFQKKLNYESRGVKKALLAKIRIQSKSGTFSLVTGVALIKPGTRLRFLTYSGCMRSVSFNDMFEGDYEDILFQNGEFYAWEKQDNCLDVIKYPWSYYSEYCRLQLNIDQRENPKDQTQLVECGGDVLIVRTQFVDQKQGSLNRRVLAGFKVFKLLRPTNVDGSASILRLHSLGGHALFLDNNGWTSLPVGRFSQFEEDHIYFILEEEENEITPASRFSPATRHQHYGLYSLNDGSIKPIPNLPSSISHSLKSLWFFPTSTTTVNDERCYGTAVVPSRPNHIEARVKGMEQEDCIGNLKAKGSGILGRIFGCFGM